MKKRNVKKVIGGDIHGKKYRTRLSEPTGYVPLTSEEIDAILLAVGAAGKDYLRREPIRLKRGKVRLSEVGKDTEELILEYGRNGYPLSLIVFETAVPLPVVCRVLLRNGIPLNTHWIYGLIDAFDGGWQKLSCAQQDFLLSFIFEMLRSPEEMFTIVGLSGEKNVAHSVGEFALTRPELKDFLQECGLLMVPKEIQHTPIRDTFPKCDGAPVITNNPYILERYRRFVNLNLGDHFE